MGSDEGQKTKYLLYFTLKKDLMSIELVWNDLKYIIRSSLYELRTELRHFTRLIQLQNTIKIILKRVKIIEKPAEKSYNLI